MRTSPTTPRSALARRWRRPAARRRAGGPAWARGRWRTPCAPARTARWAPSGARWRSSPRRRGAATGPRSPPSPWPGAAAASSSGPAVASRASPPAARLAPPGALCRPCSPWGSRCPWAPRSGAPRGFALARLSGASLGSSVVAWSGVPPTTGERRSAPTSAAALETSPTSASSTAPAATSASMPQRGPRPPQRPAARAPERRAALASLGAGAALCREAVGVPRGHGSAGEHPEGGEMPPGQLETPRERVLEPSRPGALLPRL
mmetsp:Transcript_59829/g.161249  ORF Transcript_59829/g.161249 Transcript_59829/m.161249 type:complete len:263 (+) Transcript_59829:174-962(+)